MRNTAVVVVMILALACSAFAQDEVFSDDFETGLPYAWSGLTGWAPSVEIEPDFAGLASQYVKPEDGATITAVGADGTEYTLTIPPDALMKPVVIIMIPIAAIPNLPLTDGLGAGVELLPDGLSFFKSATLEITPASGTVPATAAAFAFKENGTGFHLYPHLEESGTVTIPITEFSGYGFGLAGDLSPLSNNDWMTEAAYLNEIARKLAQIEQDVVPDPAVVGEIEQLLRLWHENVVMTTADAVSLLAAQCGSNTTELLNRATNKQLLWERVVVDLLSHIFHEPFETFEAEFDTWWTKEASFCNQIDTCDEACGAKQNICDSIDQIKDLVDFQRTQDLLGLECGVTPLADICQGRAPFIGLVGVDVQCGAKIPIGGSVQIAATPRSIHGFDVSTAHLSNPAGGSPVEWTVNDPSIASLAGIGSELEVTAHGHAEGRTLVWVTVTQCERKVIGGCAVEVGDPLRVRIGGCEWDSTSCHLPSLAGASTTVDVEALFDDAGPTDEIQIAVQPYRPLGDINIAPAASSCSQFPGDWGGLGCAGTAAPGEPFTVGLTGLEPEFPVFAVHVKAQFEGAEQEAVAWAYSTDICSSEETSWSGGWWMGMGVPVELRGETASGIRREDDYQPPDFINAEFKSFSGATTCVANEEDGCPVFSRVVWWDTILVTPKDLRLFDSLLDTEGTLETPISGAGFATAASQCEPSQGGANTWVYADGYSETWTWEVIPNQDVLWLGVYAGDMCYDGPAFRLWETDHTVYAHSFGRPSRFIGRGYIDGNAGVYHEDEWAHSHVNASVSWDVVNAATWEGDYLSLHDFRIFSCSGEFDLNWPP